ncbi:hypothetical protein KVR01_001161 [Diaporthe batatas]|uniref:uncharacterized protein n=1 Tax=Diaporthe batatas TaxID=748121 RepID=UPI001D05A794|nr:uncharacterized protein KVR01_001161 [Diaporthe batatas]KAG8168412.1 hypothetical protein KVR01_001161 [Diaporthe batatas]
MLCAELFCDVAAPAFCIAHLAVAALASWPSFQRGDPVSHVTQRPSFPSSIVDPVSALSLPLALSLARKMSSFNSGRPSEKRPANRDPQQPQPTSHDAGRALMRP